MKAGLIMGLFFGMFIAGAMMVTDVFSGIERVSKSFEKRTVTKTELMPYPVPHPVEILIPQEPKIIEVEPKVFMLPLKEIEKKVPIIYVKKGDKVFERKLKDWKLLDKKDDVVIFQHKKTGKKVKINLSK